MRPSTAERSGAGIVVAVLAAGGSRRFGSPKLLGDLAGRPLLHHALTSALAAGVGPVLCVTQPGATDLAGAAPAGVRLVDCVDWERGLSASVGAAVGAAANDDSVGAVCIGLGDQPLVGPDAYRRLVAAYRAGADLAVATYDGQRRNPVLVGRALWPALATLTGDVGVRALLAAGTHDVTEVACDGTGRPDDVDVPADLERLAPLVRASPTGHADPT